MDKERILALLREHEPELKAAGLLHLRLFGSTARSDNTANSDVDLLADYDEAKRITLFNLAALEYRLADIVGAPVHLSSTRLLRPRIQNRVVQEALTAF